MNAMLSKRFSLLFYLKKAKNQVQDKQPIYLRITIDAARMELSTQRECDPERWNSHAGRANGTREDIRNINIYLDSLQAKVYEAHRNLLDQNEPITTENIKKKLMGTADHPRMILEVFQEHNNQVTELIGKDFAEGTLQRYKTSLEHTRNFIAWKYNLPDIEITKLNYEFINDYGFWLKSVRNCNHNSTIKYLANFKKIVLICVKNGWLQKDPFYNYKFRKKEVIREYLSENELQTMQQKQFPGERLERVRDIFLFCCYTSLAYADVKKTIQLRILLH